jgi:hypothetical protein
VQEPAPQGRSLNILQRINEVRRSNAYIKKNKEVDGKYTVVTHDEVTKHIRQDLIDHGVVIVPWLEGEVTYVDTLRTMGKSPVIQVRGVYVVQFVNVDLPDEVVKVRVAAAADDAGDKGPGKLISYAVKMAILKLFNIETGDREEERVGEKVGGMPEEEVAEWRKRIDALKPGEDPNPLWREALAACKVHDDPTAKTQLRSHLTAKLSTFKTKEKAGERSSAAAGQPK